MHLKKIFFFNNTLKQTFLKNTFWLSAGELLAKLFKFFLIPLSARLLGPEKFGLLGYVITLATAFFIFSDFGLGGIFAREYRKENVSKETLISTLFVIKMVLLFGALIVASAAYFTIRDVDVQKIYFIILATVFFDELKKIGFLIASSEQRTEYRFSALIVESSLTTVIGLYVLYTLPTLIGIAWAYFFGNLASWLVTLFLVRKYLPKRINTTLDQMVIMLKTSVPFLLTTGLTLFMVTTDSLFVKWFLGAKSVGYYQAALRLVQLGFLFVYVVNLSLYPIMSGLYNQKKQLSEVLKQGLGVLLMVGIPLFIAGEVLATQIFLTVFGKAYTPSINIFRILLFSLLLEFILSLVNNTLLVLRQEKANLKISGLALIINAVLNLLLIPIIGIKGAVLATVIAKTIDLFLTWILCKKNLSGYSLFPSFSIIHLAAGLVMGIQLFGCYHSGINLYINSAMGILTYVTCLILFREPQVWRLFALIKKL